ncbi:MAG TPA: hypothetical protein VG819_02745 [Rhizomicrobium sp.]|jgi:hypothetical protein|nr:hypothetical protein [Rhizomicrobium sp.]
MRSFAIAVPIAAALLLAQTAGAQTGRYDVKTMNFDLWCQETAKINPDRCDKRLPEDEKRFEAYRAKIEKYEIPYLQRKENEILLDRNVLHNDPVGNPLDKNYEAQTQSTPQTNSNPQ